MAAPQDPPSNLHPVVIEILETLESRSTRPLSDESHRFLQEKVNFLLKKICNSWEVLPIKMRINLIFFFVCYTLIIGKDMICPDCVQPLSTKPPR